MLYRCMFHTEPFAGYIIRYCGGGYFANAANEIVEVDYDYLASVILTKPSEGYPAHPYLSQEVKNTEIIEEFLATHEDDITHEQFEAYVAAGGKTTFTLPTEAQKAALKARLLLLSTLYPDPDEA
jgi:hypothetical protein